jgi:hypothetical protein
MAEALDSDWGRLFLDWESTQVEPGGEGYALIGPSADVRPGAGTDGHLPRRPEVRIPSLKERLGLVVMAVRESPEVKRRTR